MLPPPPCSTLFPYTTLFRSLPGGDRATAVVDLDRSSRNRGCRVLPWGVLFRHCARGAAICAAPARTATARRRPAGMAVARRRERRVPCLTSVSWADGRRRGRSWCGRRPVPHPPRALVNRPWRVRERRAR